MAPRSSKRPRSPSLDSSDEGRKSSDKVPKTRPGQSKAQTLSNRTSGPLVRSQEALASLAEKKTETSIWSDVVPFVRRTTEKDFDPSGMLRFMTWNVAGLRGLLKKDSTALTTLLGTYQPDIVALQETKLNVDDAESNASLGVVEGYRFVDHPCRAKKGYSGTRTYLKESSCVDAMRAFSCRGLSIADGAKTAEGIEGDDEGRVLTTFLSPPSTGGDTSPCLPSLAVVNTYIPNSGMTLDRLPYRTERFDRDMCAYLQELDKWCKANASCAATGGMPAGFIWTGDLNVSERDYDRYFSGTYRTMQQVSGFTPEERMSFRRTLSETGAVDAFRLLYPKAGPSYTYWSARINGRSKGMGWRLDYYVLSAALASRVVDCFAMPEVMGSDHCPVQLWLRSKP